MRIIKPWLALGIAAAAVAIAAGCSGDLGIDDFQYACGKDSDCKTGFKCDPAKGCVAAAGGYTLRASTVADGAAGVLKGKGYILKSSTGWSGGPAQSGGAYRGRPGAALGQ